MPRDCISIGLIRDTSSIRGELKTFSVGVLAILIESFFFYRAGYCLRKSWISFVLINVVTHGLLALLCNGWINVQPGSFALYYIALFLAFVLETVLFVLIVNEQDSNQAASFLVKANAVSLLATFLLIFVLPI